MGTGIRSREDVETHSDNYGMVQRPAINVKVYHFPSVERVVDHFGCSEATAEKALEWAFESHQGQFWETAEDEAEYALGEGLKVYSEGRSGGWLVVHGLPDLDGWDAVMLAKWRRFAGLIAQEVEFYTSWEQVEEMIAMNEWALDAQALEAAISAGLEALQ